MRALALLVILPGCLEPLAPCGGGAPGDRSSCPTPGWTDRAFDIDVPAGWDGTTPLPVVMAFHGGGGRRRSAESVTCPDGDAADPHCLGAEANARGYLVVFPDGTGARPTRNIRTWNAGGGVGNWQCVSGGACKEGVDDMAYVDDLLAAVAKVAPIDRARVYATGLSNGGAIVHRLACERAGTIAAIASVGGENQFAAAGGACDVQVPVLAIHGTDDPCWTYETGTGACLQLDEQDKVGVMESETSWATRDGCTGMTEDALPDTDPTDGTTASLVRWTGCAADVELLRIDGGGHTWPGGDPYASEDVVGRVSHDLDGNATILDFFDGH